MSTLLDKFINGTASSRRAVIFPKRTKDDIDYEATIYRLDGGNNYKIVNLNMPYIGTLCYIIHKETLKQQIKNGEIILK